MNKTIGILAHVDAGKTTFCEQILYHMKSIRKKGRVDDKNTFLDNHRIEKQRGITIFSEQGIFDYNRSTYYLIDTPGHMDFSPDMERMISIMDYAVIIIDGTNKIQPHTKTVFRLLKNHNIPIIFFINKMDRESADIDIVIKNIKEALSKEVINISDVDISSELSEEVIEFIAERDEKLFDKYIDNKYDYNEFIDKFKIMMKKCSVYPILSGSALNDIKIYDFIKKLDFTTFTEYEDDREFIGQVYKIKHDENGNKLIYIKVIQGKIKVKDEISYKYNENIITEKINSIKKYSSNKSEIISEVNSGELVVITGLSNVSVGDYIFDLNHDYDNINNLNNKIKAKMKPTLKSKVIFDKSLNVKEVLSYLYILNKEEPSLDVLWDEDLKEIHIHVMGEIQLEILKSIIKDRFDIDVEFGKCEILYKETVKEPTTGYGHFEPLGHYAEVHLLIEPNERNKGIEFFTKAHVDDLSIGHQNLVKTHIFEKEHRGILCGYSLTDLKITLLTGKAHNKHTSGGDFREATYRALRQGIEQIQNILLEPYYKFKIEVHMDYMGRVISDILKLNGQFEEPIISDDIVIIEGRGPVSTFINYSLEITAFSKGSGSISLLFDGYDVCHNEGKVIEDKNYDKNADPYYTSNSIFCSKGKGYIVNSKEARSYMHCIK